MTQEMQKGTIRRQTLEKIAIHFGELDSGPSIVEHLKSWGVSPSLIEYPNTKWRMIFSVLWHYASSPETEDRRMLLKIIEEILHPLMYDGDRDKAKAACETFNNLLDFDNFQAHYSVDKKKYEVNYEPTDEEWEMIYEQDDSWVEEAMAEQKFWKNPEHQGLVTTLKKSYQSLINIVEVFCQNPSKPTNELNEAYQKTKRIVTDAAGELRTQAHHLYEVSGHLGSLYYPFSNLFSAEVESKNAGRSLDWDSIRPKMHSTFGTIDSLFRRAEGSDVISETDTQKVLNDVSILLSQEKEKNEARIRLSAPVIPKREPLEILLVKGSSLAIEQSDGEVSPKFPHKLPSGTRWENIAIVFLDDDRVRITAHGKTEDFHYRDMGFEGMRGRPSVLWVLLRVLAKRSGEITITDPEASEKYKKQKRGLSEALQSYFRIDFDPFHPYRVVKAYKTKFIIAPPEGGFSFEKKVRKESTENPKEENPFADLDEYMSDIAPQREDKPSVSSIR